MRFSTLATLVGLAVVAAALLMLLNHSGLVDGSPDLVMVGTWVGAFLFGIFVFGWGLGRRTRV